MSDRPPQQMPPGGWDRPVAPLPQAGPLAGWWSRVGAALVDLVMIATPAALVAALVFGGVGAAFGTGESFGVVALVLGILSYAVLIFVAAILYAPLLMMRPGERNGQTLGKQLFGIRVVRVNGVPMDFTWSAVREALVKWLGIGIASAIVPVLPYLLDVLWPLWDAENRAVHDIIVGTRVVEA